MLQSTVVNPYLLLLIILVIGGAATVPMVIYNTYNQLWMAWVLPYICICQVTNSKPVLQQQLANTKPTIKSQCSVGILELRSHISANHVLQNGQKDQVIMGSFG